MKETKSDKAKEMISYFQRDLGFVPDFVRILAEYEPEALDGYIRLRKAAMKPDSTAALPRKFKEILFVAMDCTRGLIEGAKAHARAAVDAGATTQELVEALVIVILTTGAPSVELVGKEAFKVALAREKEIMGRSRRGV